MPRISLLNMAVLTSLVRGDSAVGNAAACDTSTFTFPDILGAQVSGITANTVRNYTATSLLPAKPSTLRSGYFCTIGITAWSGWVEAVSAPLSARFIRLLLSLKALSLSLPTLAMKLDWLPRLTRALGSPGNLNLNLIEDWASRSLGELSTIGKQAAQDFFGSKPEYSYFTGCSGGGRQGLELAQTFPEAFDGILAAAPAIYI